MENMNDQEMDDLIRGLIRDKDIPFDPASWKKLESRYDGSQRRKKPAFWIPLSLLLSISLISSFFIWQYQTDQITDIETSRNNQNKPDLNKKVISEGKQVYINNKKSSDNSSRKQLFRKRSEVFLQEQTSDPETKQSYSDDLVTGRQKKSAAYVTSNHSTIPPDDPSFKYLSDSVRNRTFSFHSGEGNKKHALPLDGQRIKKENASGTAEVGNPEDKRTFRSRQKNYIHRDSPKKRDIQVYDESNKNSNKKNDVARNLSWKDSLISGVQEHRNQKELNTAAAVRKNSSSFIESAFSAEGSEERKVQAGKGPGSIKTSSAKTSEGSRHISGSDSHDGNHAEVIVIDSLSETGKDDKQPTRDIILSPETKQAKDPGFRPDTALKAGKDSVEKNSAKEAMAARAAADSTDRNKKITEKPRIAVAIMLAPDFTGVGRVRMNRPGRKVGLAAEYFFFKKLSVEAGGILSYKKYASREGYHSNHDHWQYKAMTENIEGSCYVLDIPLNLKYYQEIFPAHYIVGTIGCSSYFLFDEEYTFHLPGGARYSYTHKDMRNYLFGVINLQLGYEKKILPKIYLRAEPYLKIPLTKVGTGQARLISSGIFFSLKYRW